MSTSQIQLSQQCMVFKNVEDWNLINIKQFLSTNNATKLRKWDLKLHKLRHFSLTKCMQNFKNVNFSNRTFPTIYGILKCRALKSDQNKAILFTNNATKLRKWDLKLDNLRHFSLTKYMQNFKNVNFSNSTFPTMYKILKYRGLKSDQNIAIFIYQ